MKTVGIALVLCLIAACGGSDSDDATPESGADTVSTAADETDDSGAEVEPAPTDSTGDTVAESEDTVAPVDDVEPADDESVPTSEDTVAPVDDIEPADDDIDAETQAYVDALVADFDVDPTFPITGSEAECVAREIIDVLDVDTLVDAGVSPSDLANADDFSELDIGPLTDAEPRLTAAFVDCVDLEAAISEGITTDLNAEEGALDCILEEFDQDEFSSQIVAALISGADAETAGISFGQELVAGLSPECAKTFFLVIGVSEGQIDEEQRSCLDDGLDPAVVKALFDAQFDGAGADLASATEAIQDEFTNCGVAF